MRTTTIQPELERFVAKRMGATVFETDSSHVPMLSQPDFVLDVIRLTADPLVGTDALLSTMSDSRIVVAVSYRL